MTQEEYEKVCKIIKDQQRLYFFYYGYQKQIIDDQGVLKIEEELKKLVKE